MANIAHSTPFATLALNATQPLLAVVALSLVLFAYERALVPQYGSGPTSFLLDKIACAGIAASAIHPFKISLSRNRLYAALGLTLAPNASYWVAVWTSRILKSPVWGPTITHAVVLGPLAFILSTFVMESGPGAGAPVDKDTRPPFMLRLVRLAVTYLVSYGSATRVWTKVARLNSVSESQIYLLLAGIAYGAWIALYPLGSTTTRRNKKQKQKGAPKSYLLPKTALVGAFIAFWWSIHGKFANPVLPHPLLETYTHPSEPLQVHSAIQSVTGLITVGESLVPPDYQTTDGNDMYSARYLRASHSILGGVWMGDKVQVIDGEPPLRDSFGTPLGDSIYATFVLQEAARLVNSTEKGRAGKWKNALIIGLGTGISATSFIRHGISATIVEIDPAVYKAARTYFGLPDQGPGKIFLEDARTWVVNERKSIEARQKETQFDIVVHDCFSGGGVPEHIFTSEFWEDLKFVMQPDGVLVINFAGILRSDSSRMIIHTLEKSFGQCRAFHDMFAELSDEKYDTEFINMVIFCTRSPEPITFRRTRASDYLGSPLRRYVLQNLPSREVNLETIRVPYDDEENGKYLLTDAHNGLGKLQEEQGNHHWTVMREVLPDVHWETY